jgi:4-hydroxybenzoate polyprenyltransferase
MKKIFYSFFDFLLFSNIFMSLCAVAQGLLTFYLIGAKPVFPVLVLLFTSTLGIYNFSILATKKGDPLISLYKRVRWFFSHHRLMVTFTIVSLLSLIPLFVLLSMESRLLLIFLGMISFFYSIPLFNIGDQKFGLRHIPWLKQFMIALVWTLSIVLLPVLEAQHFHLTTISLRDITILTAKRFLFIAALTIPFDIRDLFDDRKSGLKTVPTVLGEKNAYLFCQILLGGYIFLLLLFKNGWLNHDFWALTLSVAFTGWLIFKSKWEKNEYYYFFYMDGMLILQYAFVLLFNWGWNYF